MIKAKRIRKGDTLGVVFPSSGTSRENVEKMVELLEAEGFKVVLGESALAKDGYLSGSDEIRARDINKMFQDPAIDGILCGRGGYGSPRILDRLDYDAIRENPKVFVGYSDITALHIAFTQISGLVCFHGPMGTSDMLRNFGEGSKNSLIEATMEVHPHRDISSLEGYEMKVLRPGQAQGPIIGGNLSLIVDTIGTDYEIDVRGKLLFIEEIKEEPRNVDRMLNQLRLARKLEEAEGIILGNFNDCDSDDKEGLSLMRVLEDYFKDLDIPVVYDYRAGHCEPNITLPLGVEARLDTQRRSLELLDSPVLD